MDLSNLIYSVISEDDHASDDIIHALIDMGISESQIYDVPTPGDFEKLNFGKEDNVPVVFLDISLIDQNLLIGLVEDLTENCILIILIDEIQHKIALECVRKGAQDYIAKSDLGIFLVSKTVYLAVERCNLRNQFKEVRNEYKLIFDESPVSMWVYDLETFRIIKVNTAAKFNYGYSEEEFLNLTIFDLRPSEDIPKLKKVIENPSSAFPRHSGHWRHVTKDKRLLYVDITSHGTVLSGKKAIVVLAYDITGKVKTELRNQRIANMLKRSNERYRLTSKVTQDAVWEYDFSSNVLTWNEGYREQFGHDLELSRKVGLKDDHAVHESDRERVLASIRAAISNPDVTEWRDRYSYYRADGSIAQVNNRAIILRNPDGTANRIVGAMQDITDIAEKEKELSKLNQKLKAAHKIAKIGSWTHDIASNRSKWSEETYDIWGVSPDSFTPNFASVTNLVHPDDKYLFLIQRKFSFSIDETHRIGHRVMTSSGAIKWIQERISILYDEYGQPKTIEGISQDITEEKEREQELLISNERFSIAMRATHEAIWDWDIKSDKILWSQGYESYFGYKVHPEQGTLENTWTEKIHPDDSEQILFSLHSTLKDSSQQNWKGEYRFRRADGSYAHVFDRGFIIRDGNGMAIRAVGAVLDVTETKNQLNEIKSQNDLLQEIAWQQSHHVRAPLARIMGLMNILDFTTENNDFNQDAQTIFAHLKTSSEELDQIIREIIYKSTIIVP